VAACYIPAMKAIGYVLITAHLAITQGADAGIDPARLSIDIFDKELARAKVLWETGRSAEAAEIITRRITADSSFIQEAAIIMGGDYHLIRLTNNIYPDRVGDFSPSGDKLAFARDTFFVRFEDGLFDWIEQRITRIGYFDFDKNAEFMARLDTAEGFNPKFHTDSSLFYITGDDMPYGGESSKQLMLYDIGTGTSQECFPFNTYYYCPAVEGIVFYDDAAEAIVMTNVDGSSQKTLYDNVGFMHSRRSLSLIRNFSAADDIIMFQAGFSIMNTALYGLPQTGGIARIMLDRQLVYKDESDCCPAAIDGTEFCFLRQIKTDWDVYYHTPQQDYRLTFDGGEKSHLAISRDCRRIAYSHRALGSPTDESEIYILDFALNAAITDINYRFKFAR